MPDPSLDQLRRYAIARTLFAPTTLPRALRKLGFLQADPIRAPARAQDLTLRHRVKNYRAGDLERRYAKLEIEEDFFVNYGFVPRALSMLMYPRSGFRRALTPQDKRRAKKLLRFVQEHGAVHPREVEAAFSYGQITNYWGGSSSATTHLLDKMHYRGLLRIERRDRGVRVYTAKPPTAAARGARERQARVDELVDLVVQTYAPLPRLSLSSLIARLRWGAPQWHKELKPAWQRARERLAHAHVAGVDWFWPADEKPGSERHARDERVRLLAPFDPLVWDRRRFELLWGWAYRFEAYTPPAKRKLGYYALPMLWRDEMVGWGNLSVKQGRLIADLGYVNGRPKDPAFERELEAELAHMRRFLAADEPDNEDEDVST